MTSHYIANNYPNKKVRERTTPPKLDKIREYIEVGDLGWEDPNQESLTGLSSEIGSLKFDLEHRYGGLPQTASEFAQEGLNKLLPSIIWVDNVLLKTGNRGTGPLHAVVVIGADEEEITIQDPLVQGITTLEANEVDDAWDPEYNTAVRVKLRQGLNPITREEI
jgi:hypothetical protein